LVGDSLSNNKLGPESAPILAELIKRNTVLTALKLDAVHLGPRGAELIAEALGSNTTLERLSYVFYGRPGVNRLGIVLLTVRVHGDPESTRMA
jgi:hypothetical protein